MPPPWDRSRYPPARPTAYRFGSPRSARRNTASRLPPPPHPQKPPPLPPCGCAPTFLVSQGFSNCLLSSRRLSSMEGTWKRNTARGERPDRGSIQSLGDGADHAPLLCAGAPAIFMAILESAKPRQTDAELARLGRGGDFNWALVLRPAGPLYPWRRGAGPGCPRTLISRGSSNPRKGPLDVTNCEDPSNCVWEVLRRPPAAGSAPGGYPKPRLLADQPTDKKGPPRFKPERRRR